LLLLREFLTLSKISSLFMDLDSSLARFPCRIPHVPWLDFCQTVPQIPPYEFSK
jgi:hypothetical protein